MNRIIRLLFLLVPGCAAVLTTDACFAISDCVYSGVSFSDGAVSCQSGYQFRCSDGAWEALDLPCAALPPATTLVNPAGCNCTPEELAGCNQSGQACCVSMELGNCVKKCCQKP